MNKHSLETGTQPENVLGVRFLPDPVGLVVVGILIPMIYYEVLPKTQLTSFLVAPPPPPPLRRLPRLPLP